MTRHFKGPRAGSRGFVWLQKLQSIGTQANAHEWMRAAGWQGSIPTFNAEVSKLVAQGMVYARLDVFLMTDAGLEHIGVNPAAPRCEAPAVVGPRYSHGILELSAKHRPNLQLARDGAFDYRNIPSLMGGARVPFHSSVLVGSIGDK